MSRNRSMSRSMSRSRTAGQQQASVSSPEPWSWLVIAVSRRSQLRRNLAFHRPRHAGKDQSRCDDRFNPGTRMALAYATTTTVLVAAVIAGPTSRQQGISRPLCPMEGRYHSAPPSWPFPHNPPTRANALGPPERDGKRAAIRSGAAARN